MIPNVPPIGGLSNDEIDRIKAELGVTAPSFGDQIITEESESIDKSSPSQPIKRGRGRPRKYLRDIEGRPIKTQSSPSKSSEEPLGTLASPPLTGRDQKEIANRLKGILMGITSLPAVGINSAIQMTEKEAENIATPLTTYLMRTEATSQMARRVLNEYDLAAFVIATLAYMVRVVKEVRSERESSAIPNDQSTRRVLQRVPTSQRITEPATESTSSDSIGENENGQEGPVNRGWPITAADIRNPTEV